MSQLFSFPIYRLKYVIKFLFRQLMMSQTKFFFRQLMMSQTIIYFGSTSKAMADREKKRGRPKYKNLNIFFS